ncbi:NUDIX hydrolase [Synergistales bacterium]|nr:NUDIX hydrolase [Synergistales bacterium]
MNFWEKAECGREIFIDGKTIYEGKIIDLKVDRVKLDDGRTAIREVARHRPAVTILAESGNGEVALVRQCRYAAGEIMLELPAGIVEDGEDPEFTAIRELQEEVGFKPARLEKIADLFTSPGFSDERITMFYATGLAKSALLPDDDEFLTSGFVSRSAAEELLSSGMIRDCKTMAGLLWWFRRLGKG